MASFVDERDGAFHLLAPLVPAQESYDRLTDRGPDLRAGVLVVGPRDRAALAGAAGPRHASRMGRRAGPPGGDRTRPTGIYTAIATEPFLRVRIIPSLLAAYGVVPPTPLIDADVMRATLADTIANWDWTRHGVGTPVSR